MSSYKSIRICIITHEVLRECSVDSVAAQLDVNTICKCKELEPGYTCDIQDLTLLVAQAALLAVVARISDPFHSDALANLDGAMGCVFANGNNLPDTLVATNEGSHGLYGPVTYSRM